MPLCLPSCMPTRLSLNFHAREVIARCAAALLLMTLVTACGFEPMYADRTGTAPPDQQTAQGSVQNDLFSTRVTTIQDRVGQMLRNRLIDRLNPHGEPAQPIYYLVIRTHEQKDSVLTRSDEFSTATNLRLSVDYEVRDPQGNVLTTGYSRTITRYNTLESQYATIAAEDNARERATRELAEDIRAKLAVFYAHRRKL
ncbi:LPS assembly lipoprotein LptE [Vineibacter terrae]|uniref:LPS assembly lipoprotein LptE n=1 Tax=Vineibacter terrae TaxID=2586908 RepID=UPI002E35C01A|nr:LPS assembly lipoprotein LptE [Vineibacter terrae]HEX2887483.1 LPS assembly lipoprotein LptE [Vineibacter terrae]